MAPSSLSVQYDRLKQKNNNNIVIIVFVLRFGVRIEEIKILNSRVYFSLFIIFLQFTSDRPNIYYVTNTFYLTFSQKLEIFNA